MPGREFLRAFARELGGPVAVFEGFDGNRDEVADFNFKFALVILEFFHRDHRLGFQSGVDHNDVLIDQHNFCGDHFADTHFLACEAFLKQGRETIDRMGNLGGVTNLS